VTNLQLLFLLIAYLPLPRK